MNQFGSLPPGFAAPVEGNPYSTGNPYQQAAQPIQQNNIAQQNMQQTMGQQNMGQNMGQQNMGQNMGQQNMGPNMGQQNMGQNMGQQNVGQNISMNNMQQQNMMGQMQQNGMQQNMQQNGMQQNGMQKSYSQGNTAPNPFQTSTNTTLNASPMTANKENVYNHSFNNIVQQNNMNKVMNNPMGNQMPMQNQNNMPMANQSMKNPMGNNNIGNAMGNQMGNNMNPSNTMNRNPSNTMNPLNTMGNNMNNAGARSAGFNQSRMPAAPRGGPIQRNAVQSNIMPIRELSCYTGKWIIKARITAKSARRTFRKQNGEGQLFNIDLLDKDGGEIKGTFFGDMVDKFYDMLEEGCVYTFQKGTIKNANKKYNPKAMYEITFEKNTIIEPVAEDDSGIAAAHFDFIPIENINNHNPGDMVDVGGIVTNCDEPKQINTKRGDVTSKKDFTIMDQSNAKIQCTLWGDAANTLNLEIGEPVLIKGAKVGDFGGRTLSCNAGSVKVSPDHPRTRELGEWWTTQGQQHVQSAVGLTTVRGGGGVKKEPQTWAEIQAEDVNIGMPKADGSEGWNRFYHTMYPVTIHNIPFDHSVPYYLSCPHILNKVNVKTGQVEDRQCMKKTEPMGMGQSYVCAEQHNTQKPIPRYTARVSIADHTGSEFCFAFDEVSSKILGVPAADVHDLWLRKEVDVDAHKQIEKIFKSVNWTTWKATISSQKDTWNDQERMKYTITDIERISAKDATTEILKKHSTEIDLAFNNFMQRRAQIQANLAAGAGQ